MSLKTVQDYLTTSTEDLASRLQYESSGGAQPFVSLGKLRNLIFALPPFSEQIRIVTKLQELMAICDQLKLRIKDAQQTQLNLADTIVSREL